MKTLTESEIYNILNMKCWNRAYFAKRLYPARSYSSANGSFWNKLNWGTFNADELYRLNEILRELSNTSI